MTKQEVVDIAICIVNEMRAEYVPRETGNMAFNALSYNVEKDILDITINPNIAPYVPYTNEPWLSDKWHGKKNPNEGWWQRFVEEFTNRLTIRLKGERK